MALLNNITSSGGNVAVQLASLAAAVTFGVLLFRSVTSYLRLRQVPGPFLAAWTNLPRVSWVFSKRAHEIHIGLHEKYGDLVRFGPNMVSVSDPREIPTLYPMRPGFVKVGMSERLKADTDINPVVRLLQGPPPLYGGEIPSHSFQHLRRRHPQSTEEANRSYLRPNQCHRLREVRRRYHLRAFQAIRQTLR